MFELQKELLLRTIGVTRRLILKPMEMQMRQEGIVYSIDQMVLLLIVHNKCHTLAQQDLAEYLRKDKSIILRMVDVLEKDGLLLRVVDVNDRRRNNLEMTDKGRMLIAHFEQIEAKITRMLLQGISKEEEAIFYKVVNSIGLNASAI